MDQAIQSCKATLALDVGAQKTVTKTSNDCNVLSRELYHFEHSVNVVVVEQLVALLWTQIQNKNNSTTIRIKWSYEKSIHQNTQHPPTLFSLIDWSCSIKNSFGSSGLWYTSIVHKYYKVEMMQRALVPPTIVRSNVVLPWFSWVHRRHRDIGSWRQRAIEADIASTAQWQQHAELKICHGNYLKHGRNIVLHKILSLNINKRNIGKNQNRPEKEQKNNKKKNKHKQNQNQNKTAKHSRKKVYHIGFSVFSDFYNCWRVDTVHSGLLQCVVHLLCSINHERSRSVLHHKRLKAGRGCIQRRASHTELEGYSDDIHIADVRTSKEIDQISAALAIQLAKSWERIRIKLSAFEHNVVRVLHH